MHIHQIHYSKLDSTQTYLTENLANLKDHGLLLVSTDFQSRGHGRRGTAWEHNGAGLALSFTLAPHTNPTLTSLELGVLIKKFIYQRFSHTLMLKWPNDLFHHQSKVGGIIAQYFPTEQLMVAGLGLNLLPNAVEQSFQFPIILIEELAENFRQELALELVSFIHNNRILEASEVRKQFLSACIHTHKMCQVEGKGPWLEFFNIGEDGQALLRDNQGTISEIFSGSLLFDGI